MNYFFVYMCVKTPSTPFLTTSHTKVTKRTSFNFELILWITVHKNSTYPLSYNKSEESIKEEPSLILNFFFVYIGPKTSSTPSLTTWHRKVAKKSQFFVWTISMYICVRKLIQPPFLQIVTGKLEKRTNFNFELFVCIYVSKNSIHPLSYNES